MIEKREAPRFTIRFPVTVPEASAAASAGAEVRAGGTDFMERLELGLSAADIVDLRDLPGLDGIELGEGSAGRIGARVTIDQLARHPLLRQHYPALAQAAAALATPEIRAAATLGGGLLQRSRCWYYRHPTMRCLKSGGDRCLAREGDHLYHVCFDLGPCAAPHPSTLGMALLAYDATVGVCGSEAGGVVERPIAALYGDGSSAADHQLLPGEILVDVRLPVPVLGERGGYHRAIGRARAEWPLIEVSARLVIEEGRILLARVAVGGVAPIPLRLTEVEEALHAGATDDGALLRAAERSVARARPLPMTGYKVKMLPYAVFDALCHARGG